MLEHFQLDKEGGEINTSGHKDEKYEDGDDVQLEPEDAAIFRAVAARLKFLSLKCCALQFPVKQCSKDMCYTRKGVVKTPKKVTKYLENRVNEPSRARAYADRDWDGTRRNRRTTSGGCWSPGEHLIKMCSATHNAYAFSNA